MEAGERTEERYRQALETIAYYADHPRWDAMRIRAHAVETLAPAPLRLPPLIRRLFQAIRPGA